MSSLNSIDGELLRQVMSDSDSSAMRDFARQCGLTYHSDWTALDLLVFARRWVTFDQRPDLLQAIDQAVAESWLQIGKLVYAARATPGGMQSVSSTPWLRTLSALTQCFPSTVVHSALEEAMREAAQSALPVDPLAMFRRRGRPHISAEGKLFLPVWFQTINKSSREGMRKIFQCCAPFFVAGDYFAGYVQAWRFGPEIAMRYAQTLRRALDPGLLAPLPLGSNAQLDALKAVILTSLPFDLSAGNPYLTYRPLFDDLDGPLNGWSKWLASVVSVSPTHWPVTRPVPASETYSIDLFDDVNGDDGEENVHPPTEMSAPSLPTSRRVAVA